MVLVDAFSNMSMSLAFLLSFPKRVFHDEYICLVIGVIRTFVLVINRLKNTVETSLDIYISCSFEVESLGCDIVQSLDGLSF